MDEKEQIQLINEEIKMLEEDIDKNEVQIKRLIAEKASIFMRLREWVEKKN